MQLAASLVSQDKGVKIVNLSWNLDRIYSLNNDQNYPVVQRWFGWFHNKKNGLIFLAAGKNLDVFYPSDYMVTGPPVFNSELKVKRSIVVSGLLYSKDGPPAQSTDFAACSQDFCPWRLEAPKEKSTASPGGDTVLEDATSGN